MIPVVLWQHLTIHGNAAIWLTGVATLALAVVTTVLATAAWRALGQLRVATAQLEEVQRDRQVLVFSELGLRWEGREMTEALLSELDYTPEELRALFRRVGEGPSHNPLKERRRIREAKKVVVLVRVPAYFEDAAFIAKAGGLEGELFAENFGGVAIDEWRKWGPTIKFLQEDDPLAYQEFERLAKEAQEDEPTPTGG